MAIFEDVMSFLDNCLQYSRAINHDEINLEERLFYHVKISEKIIFLVILQSNRQVLKLFYSTRQKNTKASTKCRNPGDIIATRACVNRPSQEIE